MQSQSDKSQEFKSPEATSQQFQKENLAQCRIWAHWLFWTVCPFGAFISAIKTKMWKPLLIGFCIVFSSLVISASAETEEDADTIFGTGIIAMSIVGGAMTQNAISNSRK